MLHHDDRNSFRACYASSVTISRSGDLLTLLQETLWLASVPAIASLLTDTGNS